jgi:hypothetical protein
MYKHILQSAGNINWMAIGALLTFFTVFVVSAILVFKKESSYLKRMSEMPLDKVNSSTSNNEYYEK